MPWRKVTLMRYFFYKKWLVNHHSILAFFVHWKKVRCYMVFSLVSSCPLIYFSLTIQSFKVSSLLRSIKWPPSSNTHTHTHTHTHTPPHSPFFQEQKSVFLDLLISLISYHLKTFFKCFLHYVEMQIYI